MDFLKADKPTYSPAEPMVITYDFTDLLRHFPAINIVMGDGIGPAVDRANPTGSVNLLAPTPPSGDDGSHVTFRIATDVEFEGNNLEFFGRIVAELKFAGDYDQYFWVGNTRSGSVLSMQVIPFQQPSIIMNRRASSPNQLWKFSGGALACKANGRVLQAPPSVGETFSLRQQGNPLPPVQQWTLESDGTLRSGSGLAIHAADTYPRSPVVAQSAATPGEWFLTPCAIGVDTSPNQLTAYQSGRFYLVEATTGQVITLSDRVPPARASVYCRNRIGGPRQLWTFDGQCLRSAAGNWVLQGNDGFRVTSVEPHSPPYADQQWILTANGFLLTMSSVAEQRGVATRGSPPDPVVPLLPYRPFPPYQQTWYVQREEVVGASASMKSKAPTADFFDPDTVISSLLVSVQVSTDYWAGTDDTINIGFNRRPHQTTLLHAPVAGAAALVTIDLRATFSGQTMTIKDLISLELYQLPIAHPLWSDACKIETLVLIVNGEFYNYSFQWMNEWVDAPVGSPPDTPAWDHGIPSDAWGDVKLAGRARWMTAGMNVIGAKSLSLIMIPGSHDAGMYPGGVSFLGQTQNLSIYDQLMEGIRYFDLRPSWLWVNPLDGDDLRRDLYIWHGIAPRGPALSTVLDDVARFMSTPGKEVVLLKISHYDNFNPDIYGRLVRLIQSKLGQWLYTSPLAGRLAQAPISTLAGNNGSVLVLCDEGYPQAAPTPGFFVYRPDDKGDVAKGQITVYDEYSKTADPQTMMNGQLAAYDRFNGQCRGNSNVPCDLFLLSWTLTRPLYIWGLASQVNPLLANKLANHPIPNGYSKIPNILYTDYVQDSNATDICIARNGISL